MPAYPGSGQAKLLKCNTQAFLFSNELVTPAEQSVAFQLERPRDAYPWGAAIQLACSATPGTFEIDIQGSETDIAGSYVTIGTAITTVNTLFFGRYDLSNVYFPKFLSVNVKTWPNTTVLVTMVITR